MQNDKNKIIIYKGTEGSIKVDVLFDEETAWLSGQIAARNAISHLGNPTIERVYRQGGSLWTMID